MSNDAFGNLGSEMKNMFDGRVRLMADLKDGRRRLHVETGRTLEEAARTLGETGKANSQAASRTHQMLAQSQKDLQATAKQTLAGAEELVAAIRKDVASLKADAGAILAGAHGFLKQTGTDNAQLAHQTRQMLKTARADSRSQAKQCLASAGKTMSATRSAVAGLRTETGSLLADAAGVMKRLSETSRRRASAWQGILHTLRRGAPCSTAPVTAPAASKPAQKTKSKRTKAATSRRRKVA